MTNRAALTITAAPELSRIVRALRKLPAHERIYATHRIAIELDEAASLIRSLRGDACRELRALGISQNEMAELAGVSQSQIPAWLLKAPEAAGLH